MLRPEEIIHTPAPRRALHRGIFILLAVMVIVPCFAAAVDTGFVAVSTTPPGARIFLDGNYQGLSSWKGIVNAGQHTLTLKMSKFQVYETTFVLHPMESKEFTVSMVPEPLLSFSSDPVNAAVFINGAYYADTNFEYGQVPVGSQYKIEIKKDGYKPYATTVTVNQDTHIHAALQPLDNQGTLTVLSSPSSARVFVDEMMMGLTPYSGEFGAGIHTVKIAKIDYQDYVTPATVESGKTTEVTATLLPLQQTGTLTVISTPPGASVYLDGTYLGSAPLTVPAAAGSHTVRVSQAGYSDQTVTVSVVKDQNLPLYITLVATMIPEPTTVGPTAMKTLTATATPSPAPVITTAPAPAEPGSLALVSRPAGANVYVDGKFAGTAPLRVSSVAAGSHEVLFTLNGYTDFSTTATVRSGESTEITALMAAAGQTGGAPVQPTKAAGVGILTAVLALSGILLLKRR
ncbi:MAG: PEGA domain-containing protein [Methanomicrobiales archaeon]|nr:PEGA domain-containing protein [Methanomicrobiales archaeon]